eukprot:3881098-Pleurochrysis_carterae.AAC.1
MTPARESSRLAPARDVVRAPKSKEALSANARHRHAAEALAALGGDALGCTDATGEELSRVVARCNGHRTPCRPLTSNARRANSQLLACGCVPCPELLGVPAR